MSTNSPLLLKVKSQLKLDFQSSWGYRQTVWFLILNRSRYYSTMCDEVVTCLTDFQQHVSDVNQSYYQYSPSLLYLFDCTCLSVIPEWNGICLADHSYHLTIMNVRPRRHFVMTEAIVFNFMHKLLSTSYVWIQNYLYNTSELMHVFWRESIIFIAMDFELCFFVSQIL